MFSEKNREVITLSWIKTGCLRDRRGSLIRWRGAGKRNCEPSLEAQTLPASDLNPFIQRANILGPQTSVNGFATLFPVYLGVAIHTHKPYTLRPSLLPFKGAFHEPSLGLCLAVWP